MRITIKTILISILTIISSIILFEIYSKYKVSKNSTLNFDYSQLWDSYTEDELDETLPAYHIETGLDCMQKIQPTWHHKFGFMDKEINYQCLIDHFKKKKINIAFFGGSVMESTSYKNYLTAIDYQVVKNLQNVNSINFGLSGSRLSNEYSRFSIMLKYVKPKFAIFLDGANEFHSIKYADGKFDEDFYWTVWAKNKIESPYKKYLNKLIEKSAVARIVLINLIGYKPSNYIKDYIVDKKDIIKAAEDYLHYKKLIKSLCNAYKVNCLFFLQPMIYTSEVSDKLTKKILNKVLFNYPDNHRIYNLGYNKITENEDINDLSKILSKEKYTLIDEMHLTKNGSKLVANEIIKKLTINE